MLIVRTPRLPNRHCSCPFRRTTGHWNHVYTYTYHLKFAITYLECRNSSALNIGLLASSKSISTYNLGERTSRKSARSLQLQPFGEDNPRERCRLLRNTWSNNGTPFRVSTGTRKAMQRCIRTTSIWTLGFPKPHLSAYLFILKERLFLSPLRLRVSPLPRPRKVANSQGARESVHLCSP